MNRGGHLVDWSGPWTAAPRPVAGAPDVLPRPQENLMPLNAVPDAAPDPAGDPAGAPHPLLGWLTPARRMWLYGLTLAGLPLLSYYGVVTETVAPIWAGFVLAFLSAGTAITHVSK